jgi:hypothetical protein
VQVDSHSTHAAGSTSYVTQLDKGGATQALKCKGKLLSLTAGKRFEFPRRRRGSLDEGRCPSLVGSRERSRGVTARKDDL